jgi:putative FmdB family regulatory protein
VGRTPPPAPEYRLLNFPGVAGPCQTSVMAAYDYRCRVCDTLFEVRRPMTAQAGRVRCPAGHDDATRVWSAVALAVGAGAAAPRPTAASGSDGCCGGGCCG